MWNRNWVRKTIIAGCIGLPLVATTVSTPAQAIVGYVDVAGGLTQIKGGDPFFGSGTSSPSDWGLAMDAGVFVSFSSGRDPFEIQLGVQGRYSAANATSTHIGFLGLYPEVRFQLERLYFAGGLTPFGWSRVSPTAGLDSLTPVSSTLAYFFEIGMLFPVTPKFSFGAAGSLAYVSAGGNVSPSPIMDITAAMRFYFGTPSAGGEEQQSNEFHGWRYPFGTMR